MRHNDNSEAAYFLLGHPVNLRTDTATQLISQSHATERHAFWRKITTGQTNVFTNFISNTSNSPPHLCRPRDTQLINVLTQRTKVNLDTRHWQAAVADPKILKGGRRQFISPVLIYRKCTQRNICLLHGIRRLFWRKKFLANRGGGRPLNPPLTGSHHYQPAWFHHPDNCINAINRVAL